MSLFFSQAFLFVRLFYVFYVLLPFEIRDLCPLMTKDYQVQLMVDLCLNRKIVNITLRYLSRWKKCTIRGILTYL